MNDTAPSPQPSHAIAVPHFELTLLWPVFVQPRRNDRRELHAPKLDVLKPDFLNRWVKHLVEEVEGKKSVWRAVNSEYPPRYGVEAEPGYAEFCYFHPFVRHFLYANRDDIRAGANQQRPIPEDNISSSPNRNLRILERNDLQSLVVDYRMKPDGQKWREWRELRSKFRIDLCWLYLFDTQIALLELKLRHESTWGLDNDKTAPLNLRMTLKLQDIMRRLYAPYWTVERFCDAPKSPTHHQAGHCPKRLELQFKESGATSIISEFGNYTSDEESPEQLMASKEPQSDQPSHSAWSHREFVFRHREPYTELVWQALIHPIGSVELCEDKLRKSTPLQFEHIEDDRLPTFSYLAVSNPRQITTGDWIRLAALDDDGDSTTYPYSPVFLGECPLRNFAYDRFWHPTGEPPGQDETHATRWLCSGYGFIGVGPHDGRDRADKYFFSNEHSGALAHFRHHYFALGMIAHFQRASLLRFKHDLAEAAGALQEESLPPAERREEFRRRTVRLMEEFVRFRTLYWFAEVSNQIQGRELFDLFGRHLRLQPLFDEVAADVESAAALVRNWEEAEQSKTTHTIAYLAAIFLVLTPALDWFGNSIPNPQIRREAIWALLCVLGGLVLWLIHFPKDFKIRAVLLKVAPNSMARFVPANIALRFRKVIAAFFIACGIWLAIGVYTSWPESDSKLPAGSNVNAAVTAPQNPNSGNEPPNQDAGGGGDRSASQSTNLPAP